MLLTASGLAIGGVLSFGLARLAGNPVFGVGSHDMVSFAIGGGILAASALLACLVPARRALAVDPMCTLRAE
jgi:putative ABC transport system permease protein